MLSDDVYGVVDNVYAGLGAFAAIFAVKRPGDFLVKFKFNLARLPEINVFRVVVSCDHTFARLIENREVFRIFNKYNLKLAVIERDEVSVNF